MKTHESDMHGELKKQVLESLVALNHAKLVLDTWNEHISTYHQLSKDLNFCIDRMAKRLKDLKNNENF